MYFKRNLPLFLRRCSYNLCIFARDLSILRVVDIIYAFSIDTYPYFTGDVVIIYAFFARDLSLFKGCRHNLCIFARDLSKLRVVDIIAFS